MAGSRLVEIDGELTKTALPVGDCPLLESDQLVDGKRLELEYLGARDQRAIDREEGILGRGPDQPYRPAFHIGEKRVLLGFVEAVDLVDEEQGASTVPGGDGCFTDRLADVRDRSLDPTEFHKAALGP